MTKKNPINITLVIILIVALAAVLLVAPRFFAQAELEINSDWWIVHNHNDQSDVVSARVLQNEYGSLMVWIETAEDENLNAKGQNLLFIGGGETFAGKVPWAETWFTLAVVKPNTQPDVWFDCSSGVDTILRTPKGSYTYSEPDNDYGFVTRAYDATLERWIVLVLGGSAYCTYTGAKLLIEDFELVKQNSWIVYRMTDQGATDPSTWTLNQFDYEIVDNG